MPFVKSLRRIVQQVTGAVSTADTSQKDVQGVQSTTAQLQQTVAQQAQAQAQAAVAAGAQAQQLASQAQSMANQGQTLAAQATSIAALQTAVAKLPKPLLVEELTGVLGSTGTVDIATTKGFTAPPSIIPLEGWAGAQMVAPYVVTKTAAKITVGAKRSKGTLLLTSGPFEDAPAGTTVTLLAIGT